MANVTEHQLTQDWFAYPPTHLENQSDISNIEVHFGFYLYIASVPEMPIRIYQENIFSEMCVLGFSS